MELLKDYTLDLELNTTPEHIFRALNEGMQNWWGNLSNFHFKAGGEFTITFDNGYWWTFRIMEYTPNSELIWKCIDGEPEFNKEWIGHVLHWTITKNGSSATLNFQQVGLTSKLHCYDTCASTWNMFLKEKLKAYLI
ncbi:SRPBCC family protein [Seonamhaeicola marinus]|uniref:Activator of Hsp90 ATPase homologue 1/2-like C-terminal domain-containing protein n=1 Tax=Seonamhaeicola marinus TaxID=1912246 RepID=A0A5D0HF62_9FLAO|nr:SRPBCC domain-containing protein [Seonamhaeicola marinus]TYA69993.1 hypothetical protein FUA24_22150 [Seonamhaeicola marinus]